MGSFGKLGWRSWSTAADLLDFYPFETALSNLHILKQVKQEQNKKKNWENQGYQASKYLLFAARTKEEIIQDIDIHPKSSSPLW